VSEVSQQLIVKELDDSAAFVLLKCFRGDDDAISHVKQLFLKLLSHLDVKDIIREMDENYRRSEYILNLITKPEFHSRELRAAKARGRDQFRQLRRTLAHSLENFAGPELVKEILARDLPWNGLHSDWGAIACWELRKRAFIALARLLYELREVLGGAERFSWYIPFMRSYYAAIRKGSDSKLEVERMVMQAIVCAAFHPEGFPFERLKEYIDVGMDVVGLHWAVDLNPELTTARIEKESEWLALHNDEQMIEFRKWMDESLRSKGPRGHLKLRYVTPYVEGVNKKGIARAPLFQDLIPTPFFEVPSEHWKCILSKNDMLPGSVLTGEIPLIPLQMSRLSFLFPHQKLIPVEAIFGPIGSGKSILASALDTIRIRKGYVILQPTVIREQSILCCLPALPISAQAKRDYVCLTEKLKIQPQPVPAKFLTICERDNQLPDSVWTVNDEIIYVDKLTQFSLDWTGIFNSFAHGGQLIIRRLKRETDTNACIATLLDDFFRWRELNRHRKVGLHVDELQKILAAQIFSKSEAQMLGSAIKVLADIRGNNLPFTFGAMRPGLIQPEVLEMSTSVFFSELPESGSESSRSTRGRILELVKQNFLSDEDAMYLPVIERIMTNRPLKKLKLFFWAAKYQPLRLVAACLPPHMAEITNIDLKDVFKQAEQAMNKKILVDFSEVPRQSLSSSKKMKHSKEEDEALIV